MKTKITFFILCIAAISCQKEASKVSAVQSLNTSNAIDAFHIGQTYHGGIIFYIDKTGSHGLIVSKSDLLNDAQSTQISWNNGKNIVTGATGISVGTGASNTQAIVNAQGTTGSYAALVCYNYKVGTYKDWYLPSKAELDLLYQQHTVIGIAGQYWSSSETSKSKAWDQEFGGGFQFKDSKSFTLQVRAVSSF